MKGVHNLEIDLRLGTHRYVLGKSMEKKVGDRPKKIREREINFLHTSLAFLSLMVTGEGSERLGRGEGELRTQTFSYTFSIFILSQLSATVLEVWKNLPPPPEKKNRMK